MTNPIVSICCVTYNHAPFIREAIDGFLTQETSFPVEIILADDNSTDETIEICKGYAAQYPQKIKLIHTNSNIGGVENERRAIEAAHGKYIATCEGDDYWTDPLKLQKQVEFMESHPEYSVTWTRYEKYLTNDNVRMSDGLEDLFADGKEYLDVTTHMFLHRWITQYLTMVFRRDAYDNEWYKKYQYYRDSHQFYHLLQKGKGCILNFIGGVYRQTGEGIYSDLDYIHRQKMQIAVFKELWMVNNDGRVKEMYVFNLRYLLEQLRKTKGSRMIQLRYAWILFKTSYDIKGFLWSLKKIWLR